MNIVSRVISILICILSAFLIWYLIYGRRNLIKSERTVRVFSGLILPFIPALMISGLISYDFYATLMFLAQFSGNENIASIFITVSAFLTLFVMIPAGKYFSGKSDVIPETSAIIAPFLLILILNLLCICMIHDHSFIASPACHLATAVLCCFVVISTPLISRDRYNSGLIKISEQISEARNAHYEAIKQSNFEIRRVRHDMRNHLLVIRDLAEKSQKEELLKYIDSIYEQIESAAPPYRSGNEIADTIIADKASKAQKRGLVLSVSGDLSGLDLEATDLVTILSNILDNAIEAVSRMYDRGLSDEDKTITLEFRKNRNFIVILQRNVSAVHIDVRNVRSSKGSPDHGFGIYNIRKTVDKYGGEYNLTSTENGSLFRIETEVILPMSGEK